MNLTKRNKQNGLEFTNYNLQELLQFRFRRGPLNYRLERNTTPLSWGVYTENSGISVKILEWPTNRIKKRSSISLDAYTTEDIIYKWKYNNIEVGATRTAQFDVYKGSLSSSVDSYKIGRVFLQGGKRKVIYKGVKSPPESNVFRFIL